VLSSLTQIKSLWCFGPATTVSSGAYASVHVALTPAEYDALLPRLPSLLSLLLDGLTPLGTLHLLNLTPALDSALPSELTLAGFNLLSMQSPSVLIAQKPAHSPGAALSLKSRSAAARAASKKALWTLSAATPENTIDAESLLTESDRARPAGCEPAVKGAPRRKKACKGCTCGLAELEEEELRNSKVVVLDGSEGGGANVVAQGEKERLIAAAKAAPKATSSCGSCFLGDAFRCASCPYLGE
jgi:anamorsin